MRVLVAGATGAIGKRLVPVLIERGHSVAATTTNPANRDLLAKLGAEPIVMDGLDGVSVGEAVARSEPQAIVHEMTALAGRVDMRRFDKWFSITNQLRTDGTEHLLAAARAAGVEKFVAQSYTGWNNIREGGPVKTEDDPFDPSPVQAQRQTLAAIRFLEDAVLAAPMQGVVLRYGSLYGPGASENLIELVRKRRMPIVGGGSGVWSWTHVDDAALATMAAVESDANGVFNIVDDDPAQVSEWLPYLARVVGAKSPLRVPAWLARLLAGETVVQWMTQGRGASNAKAKRLLAWEPKWSSWREGFVGGPTEPSE